MKNQSSRDSAGKADKSELGIVNTIQRGIVEGKDLDSIYEDTGEQIRTFFNAQGVLIATLDPEQGLEHFKYAYEQGQRFELESREYDELRSIIIDNKRTIFINSDYNNERKKLTGKEPEVLPGTKSTKAGIFVPMIVSGEVRGYISIQNSEEEFAFSYADVAELEAISGSIAVALENARLFNETEQRNAELAVINSVQEGLVAEMDLNGIFTLVGERIRELFDAQVTGIYSFDKENNLEIFEYLFEDGERIYPKPRPLNSMRHWLIENKETLLVNENADETIEKMTGSKQVAVPGTRLPKSLVFVPLIVGTEVKGCVSLQNLDKEHAFPDSDVRLLATLANSMSVALENARLFNESEQRNAELAVINSVQQGLVAEMDMQGIYDLVGDRIRELFDAQVVAIATFDYESGTEHFQYVYEDGERLEIAPRPLDRIRRELIKTKKHIWVNEDADSAYPENPGEKPKPADGTGDPKSMLFVPLILGETVRGYVTLQSLDKEQAFSESEVRLLSTLANGMSVALENARLFNESEQRNAELAVINSVQHGLVAEMDLQGIYDLVGERIRELFDAQAVIIASFDHEAGQEDFQYTFEDGRRHYPKPRAIDKIRRRLIDSRKLILVNENTEEAYFTITGEKAKAVPGTVFPKSMVYVPLNVGDQVKGYVSLQNLDREHAFSESDVRLLSTLANSMSVALENARLFNETEQRNAELAVINSVQQGLVAEMDMQGIYDLIGNRIRDLFDAQVVAIATFDYERTLENFQYVYEDGGRVYPKPRKWDLIRQKVIDSGEMLYINENNYERTLEITGAPPKAVPGTRVPQSLLFVPLSVGDQIRGYVSLQNLDRENAFTEADIRLLSTLSNSMSVALENARLFNESEQRNAELAVINSVQQGLVAEMDLKGIYDLVGDRIRDLFDAQVTGIITFDHENDEEQFEYVFEDGVRHFPEARPLDPLRQKLVRERKTLLINEDAARVMSQINGKPFKPVTGTVLAKSALYVPMVVGDTVKGYVTLQNLDKENAFSESDVRLLSTLANSMSVALENARLFDETTRLLAETEQRNAELAVINSVQEGLVREMDMQAIYKLVGQQIKDVANTHALLIRTFDHENDLEHWEYVVERDTQLFSDPKPMIWANKRVTVTKEPLLINENYIEQANKFGGSGVSQGSPPKSAIFVPMIVGDVVIGSVSLQNVEEEHAFSDSDVRLLTTLTNSMSVAIENARLFNETTRLLKETEQRANELHTVNRISKALVSKLDFDTLVELVGEQMRDMFNADIVYLSIYDRKENLLHFPYIYGDTAETREFGNGMTEKIILGKEPLLINQDMDEAYEKLEAEKMGNTAQSYLGVPIIAGKEAIGVISVQSMESENRFSEDDLRLLTTIAANVGIAMQNAEAYRNLQQAHTELKSAQEQLVQQEKLASLGQLTAGIAHEIKNPLNFVNNFSDLSIELIEEAKEELAGLDKNANLEEAGSLLDAVMKNLQKILEHGKRADGIVKSMLLHSRGGGGNLEPTDLNHIVKEYVNLAFHGMRASKNPFNVDIELNLGEEVGEVPLIVEDFSRVILNLCNNAFDAMREKLNGKEHGQDGPYKPKLSVTTSKKDNQTLVRIEDNGPGIPEALRDKVLQPFFTTKKGTEGTGLGLSITNDIIKAHRGSLELNSKPGHTEFKIMFNEVV